MQKAAYVKNDEIVATLSEVDVGEPGVNVFGQVIAGIPGKDVDIELHEHCAVRDNTVVSLLDGLLELWETEGVTHLRVRQHRDAEINPEVAPDGMTASVMLKQGQGTGTRLSVEDIRQALIAAKVIRGIDLDAIRAALTMAETNGSTERVIVAQGREVENTGESSLKFALSLASGKAVTIREDGRADFKNQDRFTPVKEGDLIAEIFTPETKQEPGWDVYGNDITPDDAKVLNMEIGENIRQETSEDGRIRLFSEVSGELQFDGKSMLIIGTHVVQGDVGATTGNVKFAGPVNVTGNVLSGFYIMAAGIVKVAQAVDSGLISSERSVHIQQGIKGGGKAVIRARESITAEFAEYATLMSVHDVTIQNSCLQCSTKCNGALSLETDKGNLVGGQAQAREGLRVYNLGAKSGVRTLVSFGQDYLIGDKIELEEKELEKLKKGAVLTESRIHAAEKAQDLDELKDQRAKKLHILKLIERRTERLFWLREKFEQHFKAEVTVRGSAYPGAILESHGRTFEVLREMSKVVFYFNQETGIIEDRQLTDEENARED